MIVIKILFFLISLLPLQVFAAEKLLRIAAVLGPPHVTKSEVKPPEGALPEFMIKYILPPVVEKFKLSVVWKGAPLKRDLRDLEVGDLDLLLMVIKTPEREGKFYFSKEPLVTEQPGVIVSKEQFKGRTVVSVKEFSGKTVGQMSGTLIPDFFKENKISYITLSGEGIVSRLSNLVESSRIDGVFLHFNSVAESLIDVNKFKHLKSVMIEDVPPFSAYVAYNKNLSAEIRAEIDRQISLHRKLYKEKK